MKLKISVIVIVAALVTFGLSGAAFAFHGGGVASCESCHTMHNSLNGTVMSRTTTSTGVRPAALSVGQAGAFLLQGTDQSSTCLNCHGTTSSTAGSYKSLSYGNAATIPIQRSPGGDFGWLRKGANKGHSIVATDFFLTADTTKAGGVAPGGVYPVGSLHCSSCHDPHGKYRKLSTTGAFATTGEPISGSGSYGVDPTNGEAVGAYRILGGKNYLPKSMDAYAGVAGIEFDQDPISAAAPSTYNVSEATAEIIVNYGDSSVGMWCQQCHPKMHMSGTAVNVHPNDAALTNVFGIYNSYSSSGVVGGPNSGYTSLIPVAYDNVKTNSLLNGHFTKGAAVAGSDRVMCLSCHRAHASGFNAMLRFPSVEEMVMADAAGNPTYAKDGTHPTASTVSGLTPAELQAALYDRAPATWGAGQRTLCNKCHAKD